uniref:Uncharacterized protein n=1 Tax=Romanomermis culicivorax TaxID=13658 RepID=A0A915KPN8_ROMCU
MQETEVTLPVSTDSRTPKFEVADAIVDDEDIRLHSEREIEEVQNEMYDKFNSSQGRTSQKAGLKNLIFRRQQSAEGDLAKFVELEKLEATRRVAGQIKQEISDEEMSDENDDTLNFDELNSWRAKKF